MEALDAPDRIAALRHTIQAKPALRRFYSEIYRKYAASLAECPKRGLVVELGAGAGFAKQSIRDLITSDVIPYEGIDQVVDATRMPFPDGSVRFMAMLNVFHHIPDVTEFLREAERCLVPGGRLFLVDQHPGWISSRVLKYLHHEPFDWHAATWDFPSTGPLSGANGALAWIVFVRDRATFEAQFPNFRILRYEPHTPLRYWLAGGLKSWSLLPASGWDIATALDRGLIWLSPQFGSFTDIELVKDKAAPRWAEP